MLYISCFLLLDFAYVTFGIPRVRVRKLYDIDLSKISFDSGIECQHTVYTSQGSL